MPHKRFVVTQRRMLHKRIEAAANMMCVFRRDPLPVALGGGRHPAPALEPTFLRYPVAEDW
eukprot:gene1522-723_t